MDYDDLKSRTTGEIKEWLYGMNESIGNVNPLISICMTLCDRIAGLEEQVGRLIHTNEPEQIINQHHASGQNEKTATLQDHVREAARVAEKEDMSGHFDPMSWLDLELEDNPASFDEFFDTPWNELSDSRKEERAMAIRRVL